VYYLKSTRDQAATPPVFATSNSALTGALHLGVFCKRAGNDASPQGNELATRGSGIVSSNLRDHAFAATDTERCEGRLRLASVDHHGNAGEPAEMRPYLSSPAPVVLIKRDVAI
jgi:hypothetical protein